MGAYIEEAARTIRRTRPTARDLFYAVEQVEEALLRPGSQAGASQRRAVAVQRATELADENTRACEQIGRVGAALLRPGMRILTHCNAGWLAFVDWGSALAPIYHAHRSGMPLLVYATETRPRSQGAKLTVWELAQEGVPYVLIADTAVGRCFQQGDIDCVIVGADRIAANGDVANKIGTYTIALLAKHHGVPFYVAAPRSTFDLATPNGAAIPIEERSQDEVLLVSGMTPEGVLASVRVPPEGCAAKNPAFDVTPAALITQFITESGLVAPTAQAIEEVLRAPSTTPVV
jgi:methylthioribose-1-phosphate isomerase